MNIVCRIDKTDVFKIDDEASTIDFFDPMSFSYTFGIITTNCRIGIAGKHWICFIFRWLFLQQTDYVSVIMHLMAGAEIF